MRKKGVLLVVALAAILGVCACGTKQKKEAVFPELIIGGTSYTPYFYQDINGNYSGIDVDVAKEACKRAGYTPVFQMIPIEDRFVELENKKVDCLWSCLTIEGREDDYLWTNPYLYTQRVVVVRADSQIQSLEDLKNKRVGVQTGSTSEEIILNQLNPNFPELEQLTSFRELGEVFTALRKGYVDAIVGHESSFGTYTEEYPSEYRFLNMSLRSEAVGVAFQKGGDEGVVRKLNKAFGEMQQDKTMEEIVKKFGLDVEKNVYGGDADDQTKEGEK
mgnify:FL=1